MRVIHVHWPYFVYNDTFALLWHKETDKSLFKVNLSKSQKKKSNKCTPKRKKAIKSITGHILDGQINKRTKKDFLWIFFYFATLMTSELNIDRLKSCIYKSGFKHFTVSSVLLVCWSLETWSFMCACIIKIDKLWQKYANNSHKCLLFVFYLFVLIIKFMTMHFFIKFKLLIKIYELKRHYKRVLKRHVMTKIINNDSDTFWSCSRNENRAGEFKQLISRCCHFVLLAVKKCATTTENRSFSPLASLKFLTLQQHQWIIYTKKFASFSLSKEVSNKHQKKLLTYAILVLLWCVLNSQSQMCDSSHFCSFFCARLHYSS